MVETERGCGWRQIGGVYLCCDAGLQVECDALPIRLKPCVECGFQVRPVRGIQAVHIGFLLSKVRGHDCREGFQCPVCKPDLELGDEVFLNFVGSAAYSPESFLAEAKAQGVSRRIAPGSLPREFKIGKSWIYLAHRKVPFRGQLPDGVMREEPGLQPEPEYWPAIFYAFKPTRMEVVLGDDAPADVIQRWEDQGYFVVLVDHKDPKHQKDAGRK